MLGKRHSFLTATPPPGYVAGVGRGATGFAAPEESIGPGGLSSGQNAPEGTPAPPVQAVAAAGENGTYDEWSGYAQATDPSIKYSKEDDEADMIYEKVDEIMDSRRKRQREENERKQLEDYRRRHPKIQAMFSDLKSGLSSVSEEEWLNIPEIGDRSLKKKKRPEVFSATPDSILDKIRRDSDVVGTLDTSSSLPGDATPATADFRQLSEAGKAKLSANLDRVSDSVTGQTVVNPKGYLDGLSSVKINTEAEISDLKRARELLQSVVSSNQKHAPGWIAAARLEEFSGKVTVARQLCARGVRHCPKSEDLWLEYVRLQTSDNARVVLADAVRSIPRSVKLWLKAAELETEKKNKRKVLHRALLEIPESIPLWKAAVELEDPDGAKILLGRAVEAVPNSIEMWLALAHLETYDNARRVLNKAREALPAEPVIWITAAQLEEANGNSDKVEAIIKKAVESLVAQGVEIERPYWLEQAKRAEKAEALEVCRQIVCMTVGVGIEDEDRKSAWYDDADAALEEGCSHTARAIYAHMLAIPQFKGKKGVWIRAADVERRFGSRESLDAILKEGVSYCPNAEILWLMGAKERWLRKDIVGARAILAQAFSASPNSEAIWLAAAKLEVENGEFGRGRLLFQKARGKCGTSKVWRKSIYLEIETGSVDRQHMLCVDAVELFPHEGRFWLLYGKLLQRQGRADEARKVFSRGLSGEGAPDYVPLWVAAGKLEESVGKPTAARAILERARLAHSDSPVVWIESIDTDLRSGNERFAKMLLASALQKLPVDGQIWAKTIEMEPEKSRRTISQQALLKCSGDPYVLLSVARLFWSARKLTSADKWFRRAVDADRSNGDTWAYFYKFVSEHDEAKRPEVMSGCVEASPTSGALWRSVRKEDVTNWHKSTAEILVLVSRLCSEF